MTDNDLELNIQWQTDGEDIDFEQEPRFVQQSDFSLSITKTTELDSGKYTCVASTDLDEVSATASLIVQGKFLLFLLFSWPFMILLKYAVLFKIKKKN